MSWRALEGGYNMGASLKLTTALYLLMGLGINASLISYGVIQNHDRRLGQTSWNRPTVLPMILCQGEDPPPPPDDKLSPDSGDSAGGRYVDPVVDVSV